MNCTDETTCHECEGGFEVNEEGVCTKIVCLDGNCMVCSEASTCSECQPGFVLDEEGICKKGE